MSETRTEPYDVLELELSGVQVGDEFFVGGRPSGVIKPPGACRTPNVPWCHATDTIECPTRNHDGGCNAGGGGAAGLALAIAALLRRLAKRC